MNLSRNEVASRAAGFLGSGTCSGSHLCLWSGWVQIWVPSCCMFRSTAKGIYIPGSLFSASAGQAQVSEQGSGTPGKRSLSGDATHIRGCSSPCYYPGASLFVKFSITVQRLKKAKPRGKQHIGLEDWQTALCPDRRIFPSCLSLRIGYWVLLGVHFFPYQPSLSNGQH